MTKRIVSGIFILTALGALGVILAGALTSGEQLIVRFLTAVIVAALGLYVISDLRLQADDDAAGLRPGTHPRLAGIDAPPNSTAAFMATVTQKGESPSLADQVEANQDGQAEDEEIEPHETVVGTTSSSTSEHEESAVVEDAGSPDAPPVPSMLSPAPVTVRASQLPVLTGRKPATITDLFAKRSRDANTDRTWPTFGSLDGSGQSAANGAGANGVEPLSGSGFLARAMNPPVQPPSDDQVDDDGDRRALAADDFTGDLGDTDAQDIGTDTDIDLVSDTDIEADVDMEADIEAGIDPDLDTDIGVTAEDVEDVSTDHDGHRSSVVSEPVADGGDEDRAGLPAAAVTEFEYSGALEAPVFEWPAAPDPGARVPEPSGAPATDRPIEISMQPVDEFDEAATGVVTGAGDDADAPTDEPVDLEPGVNGADRAMPAPFLSPSASAVDYADAPLAPIIDLRNAAGSSGADINDAIKTGEVEVVAALIEQGMLSTDGPISDRDVRTMVYVAFTSNELRKLLVAGGTPDSPNPGIDLGPVELFQDGMVQPPKTLYPGPPVEAEARSQLG